MVGSFDIPHRMRYSIQRLDRDEVSLTDPIEEMLEITKGQYNHKRFAEFFGAE